MKKNHIVVLTNGFVYHGTIEITDGWIAIRDAKNIRRWGTKRGLGELALHGPTKETVMDEVGFVQAPLTSLVHLIECQHEAS